MKFFMTLIMVMVTTSVFASNCELGSTKCSKEECVALNSNYGLNADKKCIDLKGNEKETKCAGIVSSSAAKSTSGSAADAPAAGAAGKTK